MRIRKTPEEFANELKLVHPTYELRSKYITKREKVKVYNPVTNHHWSALPGNLLRGSGDPSIRKVFSKCAKESLFISRWKSMKNRCYNPNAPDYKNYGAKGVTVCSEWFERPDEYIRWCESTYPWNLDSTGKLYCLDKDLKTKGCDQKTYSPLTCCWLSHQQNIDISQSYYAKYGEEIYTESQLSLHLEKSRGWLGEYRRENGGDYPPGISTATNPYTIYEKNALLENEVEFISIDKKQEPVEPTEELFTIKEALAKLYPGCIFSQTVIRKMALKVTALSDKPNSKKLTPNGKGFNMTVNAYTKAQLPLIKLCLQTIMGEC